MTKHTIRRVQHRLLDRPAAVTFLNQRALGTITFTLYNRATIEPVYYTLGVEEEWVYLRTVPGSVLSGTLSNPWVGVIAGQEKSATSWTTVIVYGKIFALSPKGDLAMRKAHAHAVDLLKVVAPESGDSDSSLNDDMLFRVRVESIAGRCCLST